MKISYFQIRLLSEFPSEHALGKALFNSLMVVETTQQDYVKGNFNSSSKNYDGDLDYNAKNGIVRCDYI